MCNPLPPWLMLTDVLKVKTMHGKVRYGVKLLVVYLLWCSLSLSSKLSTSDWTERVCVGVCSAYMHGFEETVHKWMLTGCYAFPHPFFSAFGLQLCYMYFTLPRSQVFLPSSQIFLSLVVLLALPLAPPLQQPLPPIPTVFFRLAPSGRFFTGVPLAGVFLV